MKNEYTTLARLFHADRSSDAAKHHDDLVKARLEADSTFRTGIITPLGELFIATPAAMSRSVEDILLAERRIEDLWNQLPARVKTQYVRTFAAREIQATSEIEGINCTPEEAVQAVAMACGDQTAQTTRRRGPKQGDGTRFVGLARLYMGLCEESVDMPRSLEDLSRIYEDVSGKGLVGDGQKEGPSADGQADEAQPGAGPDEGDRKQAGSEEEGTSRNAVGRGQVDLNVLLTEMIGLVQSDAVPNLQSGIASHFLFEYMQPNHEGNGQVGRYLLALGLNRVLTRPTTLTLSQVINEHRSTYRRALAEAEDRINAGELTFFVMTILDLIGMAQEELANELGLKTDQLVKACDLSRTLSSEHELTDKASTILCSVMQGELFGSATPIDLDEASDLVRMKKQTTRKYIDELDRNGFVSFTCRRPLKFRGSDTLREQMGLCTEGSYPME